MTKLNLPKFLFTMIGISILFGCGKKNTDRWISPKDNVDTSIYKNPVFEPILADPTVVQDPISGYFYAYGTQDNWGDGAGDRLVPILRSLDLVNWINIGQAFVTRPTWKNQGFIWAPDVVHVDGNYLMYYAYSLWGDPNPGIGVAVSSKPQGPFTDRGKVFLSNEVGVPNSIDPFYWEEEGNKYLFWGSFSSATSTQGTYGVRLSADGLSAPNSSANKFKIAAGDFEAVVIHKRNGYYYFIGSKGSCCVGINSTYHVLVARSKSLTGPYLDKEGKDVTQRGNGTLLFKGNDVFVGTGHTSRIITDDNDTDWILYHGISSSKGTVSSGASRRVLMLDRIVWENDWPTVHGDTASSTEQDKPAFR
ncbi:MAG TPA: family 43 glycosylhydrolase [Sphingobacterium sp.]|nr:family 43 glycosylhydrolase [Sphingobacterium sp.]